MHTAELRLSCGTPARAQVLKEALSLEAEEGPEGSATALSLDGSDLRVAVSAGDVSGLRAALNSVVRLADTAARLVGRETIE